MSPPDTNIEKQRRRHWGPLVGITVGLGFALTLFVVWLVYEAEQGTPPRGADVQIDGRTGDRVVTPPDPGAVLRD